MWHDIVNLHLNHSEAMVVDLLICNSKSQTEKEHQDHRTKPRTEWQRNENGKEGREKEKIERKAH